MHEVLLITVFAGLVFAAARALLYVFCPRGSNLGVEPEEWFCNYYHCRECDESWEDEWSCGCEDECPSCGVPHTPYKSEKLS